MSIRQIIQTFEAWRASGAPIVLATVYETAGSTYSKAGARILIGANGDYRGLVSGGCLEGDLAERARAVLRDDRSAVVTYDLRDEVDEIWGLGVGCNGLIRVFMQPLQPARGYEPFGTIAECLLGAAPGAVATVIESADAAVAPGATLVSRGGEHRTWGIAAAAEQKLAQNAHATAARGTPLLHAEPGLTVLYAPLRPIPRLLILGAGLDAVPLVAMAAELGWFVTVADHRPAYLQRDGFARAERAVLVEPTQLGAQLVLDEFDAIVVMSHHLPTDRKYLAQLGGVAARYLGVLGPAARRDRLLAEVEAEAPGLRTRLKGPVGLDIGADSPESIALSILAELQSIVSTRGQ